MIHLKRQLGASQLVRLCTDEPIVDAAVDSLPRGGSYKCILARSPWLNRRRRTDEIDISTSVGVDQRAANCQEPTGESCTVIHRHAEQVSIVAR